MFSKIIATLFAFEQKVEHDVEAIIANFTDTVTKLEAAAVAKAQEAEQHMLTSEAYEQLGDAAYSAAEKAHAIAANIKSIITTKD